MNTSARINSNYILQNVTECVMISPYSEYGKEVNRARYGKGERSGLLHAVSSGRDATARSGKCNAVAASRQASRVQDWGSLAHQQSGICTVLRNSEERLSERKLTSVGSTKIVTCSCSGPKWQSLADATCCNYHTPQQERQVCCGVIFIETGRL